MTHERFTQLYTENERGLYGFVYSLLPDRDAADDVIQAAMVQLWEHFEEYDSARPFFAWACQFTYRQVLMYRRRESTQRRFFSEATLELLSQDSPLDKDFQESRVEALKKCLNNLTDRQRNILHHRYAGDVPLTELSAQLGQSVNAIYKALERTRSSLVDCVNNKLAAEGHHEV